MGKPPRAYTGVKAKDPPGTTKLTSAPTSSDNRFPLFHEVLDTSSNEIYKLVNKDGGVATWVNITGGDTALESIVTDSGTVTPSSNAVTWAGGSNISTSGSGSTATVALDDDVSINQLDSGNVRVTGNTISSTDTDGDINLTPDGSGTVVASSVDINGGNIDGTVIGASSAADATFTRVDVDDLTINGQQINNGGGNIQFLVTDQVRVNASQFNMFASSIISLGATSTQPNQIYSYIQNDKATIEEALSFSTTDATTFPRDMFILNQNTAYNVKGVVVVARTNGTPYTETKAYDFMLSVSRENGASDATIRGTPILNSTGSSALASSIAFTNDTFTLQIQLTGEAGKDLDWSVRWKRMELI